MASTSSAGSVLGSVPLKEAKANDSEEREQIEKARKN